ncbi:MAG TPA: DUF1989 domain-containing protein, partial [Pseudorhizobium sp.]|nr:DUF1989 domain-containing protein [Pseudorhizobium sp.]
MTDRTPFAAEPDDAVERRSKKPVVVYPNGTLVAPDLDRLRKARETLEKVDEVIVPPRDGRAFKVPKGQFFRVVGIEGPQVGDLNLWN